MPTSVSARDNGHTAKNHGNPLGIECEACKRRALVQLDRLGNVDGDILRDWPFKCSACGSRWLAQCFSLRAFAPIRRPSHRPLSRTDKPATTDVDTSPRS